MVEVVTGAQIKNKRGIYLDLTEYLLQSTPWLFNVNSFPTDPCIKKTNKQKKD